VNLSLSAPWAAGSGLNAAALRNCAQAAVSSGSHINSNHGINKPAKEKCSFLNRVDFIGDLFTRQFDGAWSPISSKENILNSAHVLTTRSNYQMAQAKSLSPAELDALLEFVSRRSYATRNRLILSFGFHAGMRVGEIASLTIGDVMNADGTVKTEVRLSAEQTKGRHPRTVFMPQRLQTELQTYLDLRQPTNPTHPLFVTAGRRAFTANVMTQHLFWLYRAAGISGASSHSGRRTFITNLASKGIGVRLLASLAGHRSIAVTQKYIDVNDDMKRNAVELA